MKNAKPLLAEFMEEFPIQLQVPGKPKSRVDIQSFLFREVAVE